MFKNVCRMFLVRILLDFAITMQLLLQDAIFVPAWLTTSHQIWDQFHNRLHHKYIFHNQRLILNRQEPVVFPKNGNGHGFYKEVI